MQRLNSGSLEVGNNPTFSPQSEPKNVRDQEMRRPVRWPASMTSLPLGPAHPL